MKRASCLGLVPLAIVATVATERVAKAQSDVTPPLPNVLILLDSSGSMERLPDGTFPSTDTGTCTKDPNSVSSTSGCLQSGQVATVAKTRWIQALEVLGGSIGGGGTNYGLLAEARTDPDFATEYGLGGASPYDAGYQLYHYRPLSKNCAMGGNVMNKTKTWPNDWSTWSVHDFGFRLQGGTRFTSGSSFLLGDVGTCDQSYIVNDGTGLLDTFRDQARFALMMFDTSTFKDTGWLGSGSAPHDPIAGMNGLWSYFHGWDGASGNSPAPQYGWPASCTLDSTMLNDHQYELGARNESAPPWEGPLVQFASDDSTSSLRAVNDRIRYAIMAARPYGATPIGPMMSDAEEYYWNDPEGPKGTDQYLGCRGNFIILITDGFPNEDLRDVKDAAGKPSCQNTTDPIGSAVWNASDTSPCPVPSNPAAGGGCCPAHRAQDIAYTLANPPSGKPPVKTFVVGFALTNDATGAPVDCTLPQYDPVSGNCASLADNDPGKPCCTLHQIAYNGGTQKAFFASSSDTLRTALLEAMAEATATTSTSRTIPVFTSSVTTSAAATAAQYEFRTSFKVNVFSAWSGTLERVRWTCNASGTGGPLTPTEQPFDANQGDDLAAGINGASSRNFFSWNGIDSTAHNLSNDSIRRYASTTGANTQDGLTGVAGSSFEGSSLTFRDAVTPESMNVTTTTCNPDTTDANTCKQKYLNYAIGLPAALPQWLDRTNPKNVFGDIYHATPVSVGVPDDFLADESYTDFRRLEAARIPFLLAATNDGILHAIQTNLTDQTNPELWGFIPPAVLPSLAAEYGGAHALLLDMAPVVKDVAFGPSGSLIPWGRTRDQARGGSASWHTIAVGGLTTGKGYYAIDVTNPARPEFLWQLTTVKDKTGATVNLFGDYPATPAIGTIYYAETAGSDPIETPVAFLAGGEGQLNQPWPNTCARWKSDWNIDGSTTPRAKTRCWIGPGSSLTVVRLYDGKILRTFRNDPAGRTPDHPAEPNSPVNAWAGLGVASNIVGTYQNIDAALVGPVSLYPASVGAITTRAFVGDADGDLWKVDTTDSNPLNWTLALFHDAYAKNTFGATSAPPQPVSVPAVITSDNSGEVTVIYATGDQANFSANNVNNMFSVTEKITVDSVGNKVTQNLTNWELPFTGGVTPTGPISLFSGQLFFSTFTPNVASDSACLNGQGTLWSVDYLATEPGTSLPVARFTQETGDTIAGACPSGIANQDGRAAFAANFRCLPLAAGTIVFGAGVTQRPSCVDTEASIGTDPYMGTTTSHQQIGSISPGQFQLVAQTGPKAASSSDTAGTQTKTFVRTLTAPVSVSAIESWASIVE